MDKSPKCDICGFHIDLNSPFEEVARDEGQLLCAECVRAKHPEWNLPPKRSDEELMQMFFPDRQTESEFYQ